MRYNIKPLKQATEFGCLATCYFIIKNYFFGEEEFMQEAESELTKEAFNSETGFNEHVYLKKLYDLGCEIKIIVETPYMVEGYSKLNTIKKCDVRIEWQIIDIRDFEKLLEEDYIIITLIDLWYLDMTLHFPHYVVVSKDNKNSLSIIDPKYGVEIEFSKQRFICSLNALKEKLGYSPLIFAIRKKQSQTS